MNILYQEGLAQEQLPLRELEFARWRLEDGPVATTFHHVPGGYLVRFLARADFLIELDRLRVTSRPVPSASRDSTNDLYLNQVLPMIRGQLGELIVHASAVTIEGGVAAFVGSTGRGKSTLAAAFAHNSSRFLTDDGLELRVQGEHYIAHPNRPSLRLWQDTQAAIGLEPSDEELLSKEKSRVKADDRLSFERKPGKLRVLYFLGAGDALEISIEAMSVKRALAELLNHSFLLDVGDRSRLAGHFSALGELVEAVPCFALDYPRQYAILPEVITIVSRHAKEAAL